MKKSMKKLLSLVMVIAALAALTVPALAADAVVSRQGTNGLVIETTGSGYTDTDLFGNFKNVMPGDELTENITIKNNVSGFDYVKLYIRAEAHDEEGNPLTYSEPFENEDGHDQANIEGMRDETVVTMADFLSKLTMEVYLERGRHEAEHLLRFPGPDRAAHRQRPSRHLRQGKEREARSGAHGSCRARQRVRLPCRRSGLGVHGRGLQQRKAPHPHRSAQLARRRVRRAGRAADRGRRCCAHEEKEA